jgi:hypothetical protein
MVEANKISYEIPFTIRKHMTPEEQTAAIRSFKNFDKNNDGTIVRDEFKNLLKDMGRDDVSDKWIEDVFTRFDTDGDGKIDFMEYLVMVSQLKSEREGNFGHKEDIKDIAASKIEGQLGSHHSYAAEERNSVARLFNKILDADEYVGDRFPIDPESDDLWHVMADGLVMIRVLNQIDKDAVDMRSVNRGKNGVCNIFEVRQNIELALTAAKGRIKLVGVNASAFLEKKPHLLLGVSWQLARKVSTSKIDLKDCPEIYRLLKDGEDIKDLMKLPPEDILIRWINYHLRKAGQTRQVNNLGKDL